MIIHKSSDFSDSLWNEQTERERGE